MIRGVIFDFDGLIVDDVLVNRVTVNWQDTQEEEHFEVEIEYPLMSFAEKDNLVFVKSKSGWCLPTSRNVAGDEKILKILKKSPNIEPLTKDYK